MKVVKPGISYVLDDMNPTRLTFAHKDEQFGLVGGVTDEDLIDTLLDRRVFLNQGEGYSHHNVAVINGLARARAALNDLADSLRSSCSSCPSVQKKEPS